MVICSEPAMRAPLSGWLAPYSARVAIRPGISISAMVSSLRPHSARLMSLTMKSLNSLVAMRGFPEKCGLAIAVGLLADKQDIKIFAYVLRNRLFSEFPQPIRPGMGFSSNPKLRLNAVILAVREDRHDRRPAA